MILLVLVWVMQNKNNFDNILINYAFKINLQTFVETKNNFLTNFFLFTNPLE